MNTDHHESFLQMIDESLAVGISAERERSLREHLQTCIPCQEYLNASQSIIERLSEFSFEVSPALESRVLASLKRREQLIQIERQDERLNRGRWASIGAAAFVLTLCGSFIDLQFGSLIAFVFDMQRLRVRQQLLAFWIVPSLCIFLLFPLLPFLSKARTDRQERNL